MYKLIFAIVEDANFQWMIEPLAVEILRKGLWSYKGIHLSPQNIDAYIKTYSEAEFEAVRILNECRPEHIASLFAEKATKTYDFFQQLPDNERLYKKVVQYLRIKTNAAIQILAENNMPLFFKGGKEDVIQTEPIFPSKTTLKVIFSFSYDQKALIYQLRLFENDKEIPLQQDKILILNVEPCWVIYDHQFYRVQEEVDGKKISPFLQKSTIVIPSNQVEAYLKKFVARILQHHDPIFSGIQVHHLRVRPIPVLSLVQNVFYSYTFLLQFDYEGRILSPFSDERRFVQLKKKDGGYSFEVVERDVAFEQDIVNWFKQQGLEQVTASEFLPVDVLLKHDTYSSHDFLFDLISFLNHNAKIFLEKGVSVRSFSLEKYYLGSLKLVQRVDKQHDWFDLYMEIQLDHFTIQFADLKKHILTNQREYVLPDGKIFIIPTEWFSRFKDIFLVGKVKKDHSIEIKRSNARILTQVNPQEAHLYHVLPDFSAAVAIKEPVQFNKKLRSYQRFGMQWFYTLAKAKLGGVFK